MGPKCLYEGHAPLVGRVPRQFVERPTMPPGAGAICLHPVELAYASVSIRLVWPVAKALQLIVFGSLSNPFADRISVAD